MELYPNTSVFQDGYQTSAVPDNQEGNQKLQVPSYHRRVPPYPILAAIRVSSDDAAHSSRASNPDASRMFQSTIQFVSAPPGTEKVFKCNICEYRSSIEKWHFPDGLIFCPKCLHVEAPLLRTKANKPKNSSPLCLNFILHCWPLCFVPYLTLPPPLNYLHCPQCFTFLGIYNERRQCIQPTHEFVEYNGCFSAEESRRLARRNEEQRRKDGGFHILPFD